MGLYAKYIFPRLLDWTLRPQEIGAYRRETLSSAHGRVLEIGFGTGLNLRYYPAAVMHLTAIDTERMLPERVARRIERTPFPVELRQLDASGRLPFDDDRFDTAVSTFTLCSIADVGAALAEVRRVLKREGQFLFLEHGRSDDARVARRQDFFNPLQQLIGCGCRMNRPMDRLIQAAGLQISALRRFLMPDAPRLLGEMYQGIASPGKA
jgi:ubiquinone/menaquinone biosynthesis C-methylase UbiE